MNREEFIEFATGLKKQLPLFVKSMENQNQLGKYRFSYSGDIPSQDIHWGIGQSTFAARILYIFDALEQYKREDIVNYIQTFKQKDGSYYDKYVAKSTLISRFLRTVKNRNLEYLTNKINKRAETRQALATLITLDKEVDDFKDIDLKNIDVSNYFKNLDWTKPWGSGSHVNHLIFFTKYSSLDEYKKNEIYLEIENHLKELNHKDGFYNKNSKPSNSEKIGALMKILMGLSIIDKEKEFVQKSFIDFALGEMIACDACENFNTLYVLYYCNKYLDYRREDIERFALQEVSNWMSYYHEKHGAYSFYQGKSGTVYYGAKMSQGLNEPDLHGSAMFAWGILVVAEILGLREELGLKSPIL